MFGLFRSTPQVKVEAIDQNGKKTTFYRDVLPLGESELNAAEQELRKTGKHYPSIKVTYP